MPGPTPDLEVYENDNVGSNPAAQAPTTPHGQRRPTAGADSTALS